MNFYHFRSDFRFLPSRYQARDTDFHLKNETDIWVVLYQLATEIDVKTKLLERGGTPNYRTSFAVWRDRQFGIGLSNAKQKLNIKETTYKAKHYFCSKEFKKRITTRGIFDPLPGEVVSLSHPPPPGHLSSKQQH